MIEVTQPTERQLKREELKKALTEECGTLYNGEKILDTALDVLLGPEEE